MAKQHEGTGDRATDERPSLLMDGDAWEAGDGQVPLRMLSGVESTQKRGGLRSRSRPATKRDLRTSPHATPSSRHRLLVPAILAGAGLFAAIWAGLHPGAQEVGTDFAPPQLVRHPAPDGSPGSSAVRDVMGAALIETTPETRPATRFGSAPSLPSASSSAATGGTAAPSSSAALSFAAGAEGPAVQVSPARPTPVARPQEDLGIDVAPLALTPSPTLTPPTLPALPAGERRQRTREADAALLKALVAHVSAHSRQEINGTMVPLRLPGTSARGMTTIADIVAYCRTLEGEEAKVCRVQICENYWGKDDACSTLPAFHPSLAQ